MSDPQRPLPDHRNCRKRLVAAYAQMGVEMTASTEPPLVRNGHTSLYECPHSVEYWLEPTGEQLAAWAAVGDA